MDTCPKCELLLRVGKNYYSVENSGSPDIPTKLFVNIEMLCMNIECANYAGEDINNPKVIVQSVKNELEVVTE
jgi:hypothetical protein